MERLRFPRRSIFATLDGLCPTRPPAVRGRDQGGEATPETPAWRLVPMTQLAERLSDCPVSLDGIAKGYIVEQACEIALREAAELRGRRLERRWRPAGARRD